jgi:hypothetical protein
MARPFVLLKVDANAHRSGKILANNASSGFVSVCPGEAHSENHIAMDELVHGGATGKGVRRSIVVNISAGMRILASSLPVLQTFWRL